MVLIDNRLMKCRTPGPARVNNSLQSFALRRPSAYNCILNHSTAAEGLLLARSSTQHTKVGCTIMEALRVDKVCLSA